MKALNDLQVGQVVETINGPAVVHSLSSYGTRRGDIRKEVREASIEYPTLRGIKGGFIGYVRIIPEDADILYSGEAKPSFIL